MRRPRVRLTFGGQLKVVLDPLLSLLQLVDQLSVLPAWEKERDETCKKESQRRMNGDCVGDSEYITYNGMSAFCLMSPEYTQGADYRGV